MTSSISNRLTFWNWLMVLIVVLALALGGCDQKPKPAPLPFFVPGDTIWGPDVLIPGDTIRGQPFVVADTLVTVVEDTVQTTLSQYQIDGYVWLTGREGRVEIDAGGANYLGPWHIGPLGPEALNRFEGGVPAIHVDTIFGIARDRFKQQLRESGSLLEE